MTLSSIKLTFPCNAGCISDGHLISSRLFIFSCCLIFWKTFFIHAYFYWIAPWAHCLFGLSCYTCTTTAKSLLLGTLHRCYSGFRGHNSMHLCFTSTGVCVYVCKKYLCWRSTWECHKYFLHMNKVGWQYHECPTWKTHRVTYNFIHWRELN